MMARFLEFLYVRRVAVKRLFFFLLIIIPLCDLFVERHEVHFIGDRIYGFWSIFGLVICLGMIVFWKWLAHTWLERDEDYYDT